MKRIALHSVSPVAARRGTAMVFALMALLLASLMIGSLMRTVSMSHRQLKREEFRLQANLLADAGCSRAISRLRADPDFTSEIWNIPAGSLSADRAATVKLSVATKKDTQPTQLITAIVEYPIGQPNVVRVTRTVSVRAKN